METSFGVQALNNPCKLTAALRKGRKRMYQVKRGPRCMSKINLQSSTLSAIDVFAQVQVQQDIWNGKRIWRLSSLNINLRMSDKLTKKCINGFRARTASVCLDTDSEMLWNSTGGMSTIFPKDIVWYLFWLWRNLDMPFYNLQKVFSWVEIWSIT